jgi:predicted peptidase
MKKRNRKTAIYRTGTAFSTATISNLGLWLQKNHIMKHSISAFTATVLVCVAFSTHNVLAQNGNAARGQGSTMQHSTAAENAATQAKETPAPVISFGTDIDAQTQMEESRRLAKSLANPSANTWRAKGDQHRSYFFKEANETMPYRICVPDSWDGKSPLPLVMFLHGGWNDENSYLEANDRQLIKLANKYGYLLVSPLGCHGAYGNNLLLPAVFGEETETAKIVAAGENKAHPKAAQRLSEKDVINVLELVLAEYPVDRQAMFLMGHSMGAGGTWYLGAKYADYWRALAPMSGPFVLEKGYPWERLSKKPVFISEGTKSAVKASRLVYYYMAERNFPVEYMEVNQGHGEMIPPTLPCVFLFFDRVIHQK